MKVDSTPTAVTVTLSERNLTALQLLWDKSKEGEAVPALHRLCECGVIITVSIESDDTHYLERDPGFGPEDVR